MIPREIDSAQYHTPGKFRKIRITGEILTKIENIVNHWSVAQAGHNDKKLEVENLVGLSLLGWLQLQPKNNNYSFKNQFSIFLLAIG